MGVPRNVLGTTFFNHAISEWQMSDAIADGFVEMLLAIYPEPIIATDTRPEGSNS